MRTGILALAIAGAVGLAGAAGAQILGESGQGGFGQASLAGGAPSLAAPKLPTPFQRYALKIQELHAKAQQLKAHDGGELSVAHRADLQQQLDALNHAFGVNAG
jgi:hypothetical protein